MRCLGGRRPAGDLKEFAGRVHTFAELAPWRDGLASTNGPLGLDTLVQVAEPRALGREWRTVVVDGAVVTASQYRSSGRLKVTGFRAILAPSFADIFFNNCFKNGLLPIVLPESVIGKLFDEVQAFVGYQLTVDLERQVVVKPDGAEIAFDVQPFRKHCLLGGLDDIGLTLRHQDEIKTFEARRLASKPWLAHTLGNI